MTHEINKTMKSNKEYRFSANPDEKVVHDKFKEMFDSATGERMLGIILFGLDTPIEQRSLSERELDICLNMIQWLGSPVGKFFLNECGFTCH